MDSRISIGMVRACQRLNRAKSARRWTVRNSIGAAPKTCGARAGRSVGLPDSIWLRCSRSLPAGRFPSMANYTP